LAKQQETKKRFSFSKLMSGEFLTSLAKSLYKVLLTPKDALTTNTGLTAKNLRASLERSGIDSYLFYESYSEVGKENRKIGVYEMADGRKGFILRLFPPPFLGDRAESLMRTALNEVHIDDVVIHMNCFASRNIDSYLMEFERLHQHLPNVKNPSVLQEYVASRVKAYRKWSKESALETIDFRIRDFVNLISFSFPKETPETEIIRTANTLIGMLSEFGARNFGAGSLIPMVQEILNPHLDSWATFLDHRQEINCQMAIPGTRVAIDDEHKRYELGPKDKCWYGKTLSTLTFPNTITIGEFQEIFFNPLGGLNNPLPCPFLISLVIHYEERDKAKNAALSSARDDLKELMKVNYKDRLANPETKDRFDEAKHGIELINGGEIPVRAMWSLSIFENDAARLESYAAAIRTEFEQKSWKLTEETFAGIGMFTMIASLPLQFHKIIRDHLKRFRLVWRSNNADMSPLVSDVKPIGALYNMYTGRTGQLTGYDLYSSENYNCLKVGTTGSGKSFSEVDNQLSLLASGFKVVCVDIGESYKTANKAVGGTYIQVSEDTNVCFNFFTSILTKKITLDSGKTVEMIDEDELNTIVPLIGQMAQLTLVATTSEVARNADSDLTLAYLAGIIERAVNYAFKMKGKDAGMREVYESLLAIEREERDENNDSVALHKLAIALEPYGRRGGKRYKYFNGPNTIDLESDYIVLELEELLNKGELLFVALMSVCQKVANDFYFSRARKKAFICDEYWKYKDIPIMKTFMVELFRRIRKYNGSAALISQNISDYDPALFANADWQFLLKQDATMIDKARTEQRLIVPDFEMQLMKSVSPKTKLGYGEAMIRNKGGATIMTRIVVDPFTSALGGTSAPNQRKVFYEIMKRYQLDYLNTARVVALTYEKKISESEAYEELKASGALDHITPDTAEEEELSVVS
jgi:type-IV secretion system protein TraC